MSSRRPLVVTHSLPATQEMRHGLPRESWDSHGIHSERGKETVTREVEMLAGAWWNWGTQHRVQPPCRITSAKRTPAD